KAHKQALAAWLNFASGAIGWTELVDTDGDNVPDTTFGDVMTTVESILSDLGASHADLVIASSLAESVNLHDADNPDCGDEDAGSTSSDDEGGDDDEGEGGNNGNDNGNNGKAKGKNK
ncbi:MAG: hypothetical protein QGF59_01915, partial [Pirellulaceae bacterium]|nr:hypothetical protein [Pirellulaceae bacterium]